MGEKKGPLFRRVCVFWRFAGCWHRTIRIRIRIAAELHDAMLLSSVPSPQHTVAQTHADYLETNLASRWKGVRLPRASGKSPDFPGSSPNFPGSSLTVELNSNPEVPRKFPRLPRKFPKLPRKFPDFPGGQPLFLGNENSAQSFSDRSFWSPLGSWTSAPSGHGCPRPNACFSRVLSALTEVLGRDIRANDPWMSAGRPS